MSARAAVAPSRRPRGFAPFAETVPFVTLLIALAALGVGVCALAMALGQVSVPVGTVVEVLLSHAGLADADAISPTDQQIVWDFRVPRVLLAAVVGAGLATAGTTIQAVVRNPLGDPYLVGIVPGATVGAVLVIVSGPAALAGLSISAAAFAGGLAAFAVTFLLSRQGNQWPAARLILSGVAVGYLLTSVSYFLQVRAAPGEVQRVLFWTLGSVADAHWADLSLPALTIVVVTGVLALFGRHLNALGTGHEVASSLGIDVVRLQLVLMVAVALLTGTVVSVAGGIGFVGLVIPHITRLLVGSDHRRVLAAGALVGAVFLVAADLAARTLLPRVELPIGIVTAAVGSPVLLWLLRSHSRRAGAS